MPPWLSPDRPRPGRWADAGDQTTADAALALARKDVGLVYRGSYHGARQLLAAMARRLRTGSAPHGAPGARRTRPDRVHRPATKQLWDGEKDARAGREKHLASLFLSERERVRLEHELLGRLAVPVGAAWRVELRGAPDLREACEEALGPPRGPGLLPLRDLLGMVGAHEWRRTGLLVPALGARIHPHHGVYAPIRGEYVDLVARAADAWPVAGKRALDVGTGTGVLAFVLARRGARVLATDLEPRAVACARDNAARLGLTAAVEIRQADLLPGSPADLVVANPPWLPAPAHTSLDRAVYDPGGAFLSRLLAGLPAALLPGGEAWIVLSDLAERLGLRPPGHLAALAAAAGLRVADVLEARPEHPRARDRADPLFEARAQEVTRLFRLRPAGS